MPSEDKEEQEASAEGEIVEEDQSKTGGGDSWEDNWRKGDVGSADVEEWWSEKEEDDYQEGGGHGNDEYESKWESSDEWWYST